MEAKLSFQQQTLATVEARVSALETALAVLEPSGSTQKVAARVSALEVSHQAQLHSLKEALEDVRRAGHPLHRQPDGKVQSGRELLASMEEAEQRIVPLKEAADSLLEQLDRLSKQVSVEERRSASLEEVVGAASAGLARLSSLLEGQERRTAELGQAITLANDETARIGAAVDATGAKLQEMQRRSGSFTGVSISRSTRGRSPEADRSGLAGETQDSETLWQALRELQELVIHESEHRAVGLREVLGVLGQSVEQLRGEQGRLQQDFEAKARAEARKAKQQAGEAQARLAEQARRVDHVEQRMDGLQQLVSAERYARTEAVAWMESKVRELAAGLRLEGSPPHVPATSPRPLALTAAAAPSLQSLAAPHQVTTQMVTSQSLQRLEALEARFDRPGAASSVGSPPPRGQWGESGNSFPSRDTRPPATAEGPLGKLRGQLEGLRSELAEVGGGSGTRPATFPGETNGGPAMFGRQSPPCQAAYAACPAFPSPVVSPALAALRWSPS